MKDPNRIYRTAFFTALNGLISLNGEVLPVYDTAIPPGKSHPCVVMTGQTNVDPNLIKNCQVWESTILIRCITKSNIQFDVRGMDAADEIAEQVYARIEDLDMEPDFTVYSTTVESDFSLTDPELFTDNTEVFIRDIRFRNLIQVN